MFLPLKHFTVSNIYYKKKKNLTFNVSNNKLRYDSSLFPSKSEQ